MPSPPEVSRRPTLPSPPRSSSLRPAGRRACQPAPEAPREKKFINQAESDLEKFKRPQSKLVVVDAFTRKLDCWDDADAVVFANIYDVSTGAVAAVNRLLSFMAETISIGGAFHCGIEVYGREWMFGAFEGVSSTQPRSMGDALYRCTIPLGRTKLDRERVNEVIQRLRPDWLADHYDLVENNCCTFASSFCRELGVEPLPAWVDRFARIAQGGLGFGRELTRLRRMLTCPPNGDLFQGDAEKQLRFAVFCRAMNGDSSSWRTLQDPCSLGYAERAKELAEFGRLYRAQKLEADILTIDIDHPHSEISQKKQAWSEVDATLTHLDIASPVRPGLRHHIDATEAEALLIEREMDDAFGEDCEVSTI